MDSQDPISNGRSRTTLTPTMERYFIDLMLDQMHRGNRLGHTFNKQAWKDMLTMFNAKFRCKYDRDTLKSHYTVLWKQYNDVENILEQDGFSWDDDHKMVVADAHVWDGYIKVQPDAQIYQSTSLPNFNDLHLIYVSAKADGRYSLSSHDTDFDEEVQALNTGAGSCSVAPVTIEHLNAQWTEAMDQYFIELLLDQTRKGNKSDNTFSKQAWKDMLTSFNAKFCCQYGKSFLTHRYRKLLKYYTDVCSILQQNGFSWDDKRQLMLADDGIWDKCIKVYPDACSYRDRTLSKNWDLSLTFENASNHGPRGQKNQEKKSEDIILPEKSDEGKIGHFSAGSDAIETYWTPPMDRYLTDLLLYQALRGNKIGHSFTPEAWTEMAMLFNTQFRSYNDIEVLKRRCKHLRRQYNDVKTLLEQSGFYWDDTLETVTAEECIWDSYIMEQPEALKYKNKCLPSYHKLCVIYGQETCNRRSCQLVHDSDHESGPDVMNGEEIESLSKRDYSRDYWTCSMDRYLIDLMLEQVRQGNRIGSSFNDEAWVAMSLSFVDRFGLLHNKDLLRSRHEHFGKLHSGLKNLLNRRGFSWDERWQIVTAYDDVWDEYPDTTPYRGSCNPNYNDLCLIYEDSTACARGNQNKRNHTSSTAGMRPLVGSCQRTDWSSPMDRYFIDLMLEQVHLGNMVDCKFYDHTWEDIAAKFTAQFGSQYNKHVLNSRHRILRKRFNDLKNLLDQPGFAWDESQQMVAADDRLWTAYIKIHPDARSYRNRSFPSYNDLFLIYGNPSATELESRYLKDVSPETSEENDHSPSDYGSPSIEWSKTMENYFIDLLLEQLQRGNKNGSTFSRPAWEWMTLVFCQKFGRMCTQSFLEKQYRRMMWEYNNIRNLTNQNHFAWDEFQQIAVVDDGIWEANVKEHREAMNYRDRIFSNYNALCMIFGNEVPVWDFEIENGDNGNDMGVNGIFRDLQCPGQYSVTPNSRKKRKSPVLSISTSRRKTQRPGKEMQANPTEKSPTINSSTCHWYIQYGRSIESLVDALQAVPGMNDEIFLEACKLLEDEKEAKNFLAMDIAGRRKWLWRKLRR